MNPLDLQSRWGRIARPKGMAVSGDDVGVSTHWGQVLLGKDEFECLHLLFPIGVGQEVPVDRKSSGVVLVDQDLSTPSGNQRFADLVCTDPALSPVFAQLSFDIIERVSDRPGDPVSAIAQALGDWRALLRGGAGPAAGAIGLRGELEVLSQLVSEDPVAGLRTWQGPDGAVHDFASPDGTSLEVKTTTARDGYAVEVHGLDQIDPADAPLWIMLVRIAPDDRGGRSVHQMVQELLDAGTPRDRLLGNLSKLGYDHTSPEGWTDPWAVTEQSLWMCGPASPGIRRSEMPPNRLLGVERVQYRLDLSALGAAQDVNTRLELWDRMVGATP